ncbi:probable serine/threonine-protein kinase tsuA isoform X1 [Chenopodium quinoa]|uniref:probable serine/threonine-protein kinase tsuA isoform X1 n=1 Tax=Chenopodium quinoa TaxID=63459 RepID=UPI000B76E368|nr:probable serine/threonine-protein kinase tsuA isoform X1 [Chenopodium quinoa]
MQNVYNFSLLLHLHVIFFLLYLLSPNFCQFHATSSNPASITLIFSNFLALRSTIKDMKPKNILIGSGSIVKVSFVILVLLVPCQLTMFLLHSIKGTPLYMAPELVREQP